MPKRQRDNTVVTTMSDTTMSSNGEQEDRKCVGCCVMRPAACYHKTERGFRTRCKVCVNGEGRERYQRRKSGKTASVGGESAASRSAVVGSDL